MPAAFCVSQPTSLEPTPARRRASCGWLSDRALVALAASLLRHDTACVVRPSNATDKARRAASSSAKVITPQRRARTLAAKNPRALYLAAARACSADAKNFSRSDSVGCSRAHAACGVPVPTSKSRFRSAQPASGPPVPGLCSRESARSRRTSGRASRTRPRAAARIPPPTLPRTDRRVDSSQAENSCALRCAARAEAVLVQ